MAHENTPQTQLAEAPSGPSQDLPLVVLNQIHALIAQQHDAVLDRLDRFKKRIIAALLIMTILVAGAQLLLLDAATLAELYYDKFGSKIRVAQAAPPPDAISPCLSQPANKPQPPSDGGAGKTGKLRKP